MGILWLGMEFYTAIKFSSDRTLSRLMARLLRCRSAMTIGLHWSTSDSGRDAVKSLLRRATRDIDLLSFVHEMCESRESIAGWFAAQAHAYESKDWTANSCIFGRYLSLLLGKLGRPDYRLHFWGQAAQHFSFWHSLSGTQSCNWRSPLLSSALLGHIAKCASVAAADRNIEGPMQPR